MNNSSRISYIPEKWQMQHALCFKLHDMMADILKQSSAAGIATITVRFSDKDEAKRFGETDDIFALLKASGRTEELKAIVLNHLVIPLFADTLHFIYEALTCLERRKTTVAFALLRKPLKYNLLLSTWLFADPDGFYSALEHSPADGFDDRKIAAEQRVALIESAISKLGNISGAFDAKTLYTMLFDRANPYGFAPYFDMAAHPVTTHKAIRTEPLNFNFIFRDPGDVEIYEHVYFSLAYVLMYLFFLQLHTYGRMTVASDAYIKWAEVMILGTFEAVFPNESTGVVTDSVRDTIGSAFQAFLKCVACKQKMTINSNNAARLFMEEEIECASCGTLQQFPLWWLMSQVDVDVASSDAPH